MVQMKKFKKKYILEYTLRDENNNMLPGSIEESDDREYLESFREDLFDENDYISVGCVEGTEDLSYFDCKVCGGTIVNETCNEQILVTLKEKGLCIICNHFSEKVDKLNSDGKKKIIIVDGTVYTVCPDVDGGFKGFGGAEFKIKMNDGREIVTRNMWCGGNITLDHWRDLLPDNAVFLNVGE
ncbi:hypothetical protein JEZ13_04180 [bacterium]|nr:hypothetical protein [bacterium]